MSENKTLFRKESIDRMQSPEKIDEYIRVSTPRVWILAAALSLIVAGVLIWGFVGSIPKTVSASGVIYNETVENFVFDNQAVCLLPVGTAGQYLRGHEAKIMTADGRSFPGRVSAVREDPYSYEEIQAMARSDWRMQVLWGDTQDLYKYAVVVDFDPDVRNRMNVNDRELVTVTIVLSDVRPIQYVLN